MKYTFTIQTCISVVNVSHSLLMLIKLIRAACHNNNEMDTFPLIVVRIISIDLMKMIRLMATL